MKEEMNARMWIEFGKMFNNMICDGMEVVLETRIDDTNTPKYAVLGYNSTDEYGCDCYDCDDKLYESPYLAMKAFYFTYFLKQETVDTIFEIDDYLIEKLYNLSDLEGITLDELFAKILKELIANNKQNNVELASCMNCHYKLESYNVCAYPFADPKLPGTQYCTKYEKKHPIEESIAEIDEANCCAFCTYFDETGANLGFYTKCKKNDQKTTRTNICMYFYPR